LPAPVFGWLLREDISNDNIASLETRLRDGMSLGAAEAFLAAIAAPA